MKTKHCFLQKNKAQTSLNISYAKIDPTDLHPRILHLLFGMILIHSDRFRLMHSTQIRSELIFEFVTLTGSAVVTKLATARRC